MIKIAFYMTTELEHPGGCEKYIIETASHLAKMPNTQVDVITMDEKFTELIGRLLSVYLLKKLKVKDRPRERTDEIVKKLDKATYYKVKSFKDLRQELSKYDVIYSKNELLEAAILKFFVGYKSVPPVVFGGHTPLKYPVANSIHSKLHNFLYNTAPYPWFAKGVAKFHALNSYERSVYKKLFPKKEVVHIYNPFDATLFKQQANQYHFEVASEQPKSIKILWAGRLTEQKGVDDLLQIIPRVNGLVGDSVQWSICGDGVQRCDVELLCSTEKNCTYYGRVEQKYMSSIYSQHDYVVSTSHWEGYPYGLIEPQVFGLKAYGYRIPGCEDILNEYAGGFIADDLNGLVDLIIKHVKSDTRSVPSKYKLSNQFEPVKIYNQLFNMLNSVRVR